MRKGVRKGDIHIFGKAGAAGPAGIILCDASAIAALRRSGVLERAGYCGAKLAISQLVQAREMPGEEPPGLRIEELPPSALARAFVLHRLYPRLALTDASTLALAAHRSWPLLTQLPMLARMAAEVGVQLTSLERLQSELCFRQSPPQVAEEKGTFTFSFSASCVRPRRPAR